MKKISLFILLTYAFFSSEKYARATPLFEIQWLGEDWGIETLTGGTGIYLAEAGADTSLAGLTGSPTKVPTLQSQTSAQGGSGDAQVKVTRQFRVIREDIGPVSIALTGGVDGYYNYDENRNLPFRSDDGAVRASATAEIVGTSIQSMDNVIHRDGGSQATATMEKSIFVEGEIATDHSYTVRGFAGAIGDSDYFSSRVNKAYVTLDLHDPVQIIDQYAQYYNLEWENDWPAPLNFDFNTDDDTIDLAGDIIGEIVSYYTGSGLLANLVSFGIGALGGGETVEKEIFYEGIAYTYASGEDGGYGSASLQFDRSFRLTPKLDTPVAVRFDGILEGILHSSSDTTSSLNLARVVIDGTGLEWQTSGSAMDGSIQTFSDPVRAMGELIPYETYTFESYLSVSSDSSLDSNNLAYADFASSFGGNLSVHPIPEPATILLLGTGLAGLAGTRIRQKKKA